MRPSPAAPIMSNLDIAGATAAGGRSAATVLGRKLDLRVFDGPDGQGEKTVMAYPRQPLHHVTL